MADKTLLIPGTQASTLVDQNKKVVYNAVRVSVGLQKDDLGGRPPSEWQALLSTEHTPGQLKPTATSLQKDTEIHANRVVGTPYDRMLAFAEPWPYDWRIDIMYNADLLVDYLRKHAPEDGRWNLIGHSQGGLVIAMASKRAKDFTELVARTVLVGAPMAGTMRATEALLWGSQDLGDKEVEAAKGMGRTWPALYQMLPAWPAVLSPQGKPLEKDQQLNRPEGWPKGWNAGIQEDLLKRARDAQEILAASPAAMSKGMNCRCFQGDVQDTPVTIVRTGDEFPKDRKNMATEPGDTLVPGVRTVLFLGEDYKKQAVLLGDRPERHAMLCQDEEVISSTRAFLKQKAPDPITP